MYFYQMTKYPKLFEKVYWGHFTYEPLSKKDKSQIETIVKNRNDFVEQFEIKSVLDKTGIHPRPSHHDHNELYKTNHGVIYIVSPYTPSLNSEKLEKLEKLSKEGLRITENLYCYYASTYYIEFSRKVDFNFWVRENINPKRFNYCPRR